MVILYLGPSVFIPSYFYIPNSVLCHIRHVRLWFCAAIAVGLKFATESVRQYRYQLQILPFHFQVFQRLTTSKLLWDLGPSFRGTLGAY